MNTQPSVTVNARSAFAAWYVVGLLAFMWALSVLDRQVMSLMVKPIRADLGISDFQLSLLHGFSFALLYALFGLPLGLLVDKFSRRTVIYAGVTIWSLATAACGLTKTFPQLFLARMAVGAGEAGLSPAAYSIISDVFPKRNLTLALAIFAAGAAAGNALSISLVGSLIAATAHMDVITVPILGDLKPWRVIFLVIGLPGIVLALLTFTISEPLRRSRISQMVQPFSAVWHFLKSRIRFFTCHFLGFCLVNLVAFSTAAWLPTYMMRRFDWPVSQVALVMGMTLFVPIPVSLSLGWFNDRQFRSGHTDIHLKSYAVLMLISTVSVVGAVASSQAWLAMTFFTIGLAMLSVTGTAAAALQLVTPNEFRGQISVLYLFVAALIGQGMGPSIPAALTTFLFRDDGKVGWSIALTMAVFGPLSAGVLWLGRGAMRRAVDDARVWLAD